MRGLVSFAAGIAAGLVVISCGGSVQGVVGPDAGKGPSGGGHENLRDGGDELDGGGDDAGLTPMCSPDVPDGVCPTGQTCLSGSCCSNACGSACCNDGDACIAGACCPAGDACGSTCCANGSVCYSDSSGNKQCGQGCGDTTDCSTNCCGLLQGGGGVCVTQDGTWNCRCSVSSDCSGLTGTPACAPTFGDVSKTQTITGAYVCKPDDGQPGDGCNGLFTTCSGSSWHCAKDSRGNQFCTNFCFDDSSCSNPGVACCDVFRGSNPACGLCSSP